MRCRATTLGVVLACIGLAGGAAAQTPQPLTTSPTGPTPYSSPLFHSGGASTPYTFPATPNALIPPFLNPLFGQLQGTPTGIFPDTTAGVPTQIPSFLLGNYNPSQPPGLPGIYFPNHFADGSVFSWAAPFAYVPTSAGAVTVDDTDLVNFSSNGFQQISTGDVAGTATGGEYDRLPPNTNGSAAWTLTATVPGSYSVYYHIPDDIPDTSTNPVTAAELRSATVTYTITVTGASAQTTTVVASQTEANPVQFLAGPFQLAVGDSVTVTLSRDVTNSDDPNFSTAADYLIADSMTLQLTIGDVQSTPTAINITQFPEIINARYWGIATGGTAAVTGTLSQILNANAPPDVTSTNVPVLRSGDPALALDENGAADPKHLIRQLVYFGRSEPSATVSTTSGTTGITTASTTASTTEGAIYCVDGFTGSVIWRYQTPVTTTIATINTIATTGISAPVYSTPAIARINVLVTPAVPGNPGTPAVYANKLVVIVGDDNGRVYCLDAIGNGDGTSNSASIDPTTGLPILITQPPYGTTVTPITPATAQTSPHVGTTGVYWIYRPDSTKPKYVTGASIGMVKPTSADDPNSDLPVPAAFGSASPTVFVDPSITTTPDPVTGALASNARVYLGNSNGVLYALDPLGVPVGVGAADATTYGNTGDSFNASVDLRANPTIFPAVATDPFVPTCQPLWWFSLRGANANSGGTSSADIESAPALHITYTPPTPPTAANPAGTPAKFVPTVYIGSAHEQESTSNIGRLYALNGIYGPAGNGGALDPTKNDPTILPYSGPGSTNYNVDQRPMISATDTTDWTFPDAYGTGQSSNHLARPALGDITGSPVVFTNFHETNPLRQTRIYIAANVGIEIPAGSAAGTPEDVRPDDTETGRLWAVNLDGSVGTTTNTPAGGTVWSYPLANDPNNANFDTVAEPSDPMGSFLHCTPAMGFVQFPTTIINGDASLYTHKDVFQTVGNGETTATSVPMLYIGTRGVNDTNLYAIDVDGDMSTSVSNGITSVSNDQRLIYTQISPDGAIFQSSPILVTNDSALNSTGNGGSIYIVTSDTLYDFDATPISNPISGQAFPLIRENQSFIGFGPISSPAVCAADVSDLSQAFITGGTSLNPNNYTTDATDWVYVGDSSTGLCRGITPQDSSYGGIPAAALNGIVPPTTFTPSSPDLSAIIHTFIYDGSTTPIAASPPFPAYPNGHPGYSTMIKEANPLGAGSPLPVFEWGQNVYIRFSNVVPPNPVSLGPAGTDNPALYVHDNGTPLTIGSKVYTNGGPITFQLADVSATNTTGTDSGVVPARLITGLAANQILGNGFIKRTDNVTPADGTLVGPDNTTGWMGAYTYFIGDGSVRLNTPGGRRRVIGATQTVSVKIYNGGDPNLAASYTPDTPPTVPLTATATNGNVVSVPVKNAQGVITGYSSNFGVVQPVDQPTFGILNPIGARGGGIPLLQAASNPNATLVADNLGPFRGVQSPPSKNTSGNISSGGDPQALNALANGNTVYADAAPSSTSGVGLDPTKPQATQTANTTGAGYRRITKVVVTTTGLIPHNTGADNTDGNQIVPTGTFTAATAADVGLANPSGDFGGFGLDLWDRSNLGPIGLNLRLKMGGPTGTGGRLGLSWNDNTVTTTLNNLANGPATTPTGHDAVLNYLPWEVAPVPRRIGANASHDYPDLGGTALSATLQTTNGGADLTANGAVPTPAQVGSDVQHRILTATPTQIHINVPIFQPANQQLYSLTTAANAPGTSPRSAYSTAGEITPFGIASSTDTIFPMGYVTTRRIYVPNQGGAYVEGCAYRDIRIYTGVPPDYSMQMSTPTADIGKVPAGFGVQTSAFSGLMGPNFGNGNTSFNPYNINFQAYYQPLTINNIGNVNLLNVHLDQRISNNGAVSGIYPLDMSADPLETLAFIPGWDQRGITGAQNYLIRSSLDADIAMRNPGIINNTAITAYYPGPTFHKARVGDGAPTILTVPDVPHDNVPTSGYYVAPLTEPQISPSFVAAGYTLPMVSVAIPFGTPVGTYHTALQIFEGFDVGGYTVFGKSGQRYNPFYPPQYGGAQGGQAVPASSPPPSPLDYFSIGMQPISASGTELKATVIENRMTDGLTYGALPQIDLSSAGTDPNNNNAPISTPDFAPAGFRDPTSGRLSIFWTSGRNGIPARPYTINAANVSFTNPAFMSASGANGPQWWAPVTVPSLNGTSSGLTIAQNLTDGDPSHSADPAHVYAFVTNVNAAPYNNTLYSFSVAPATGALSNPQPITNDPSQIKYGVQGLYTDRSFTNNLWAFWTATTRGRTAIYYNSLGSNGAWIPASGTGTSGLLPIPAGLTSVADAAPTLMTAPTLTPAGYPSAATRQVIEVTYSGAGPDGNTDLYQSRYLPDANTPSQLDLIPFSPVTEELNLASGWYQSRDVAWSRTGELNLTVNGAAVLYDTTNNNKPLFSRAVFDKASGLLALSGVPVIAKDINGNTVTAFTVTPPTTTVTVYVDLATGRVRFTGGTPIGRLTATFNPMARRLTTDPRADTGPITFLDPTYKANDAPNGPRLNTDRRWYVWRKAGVSGDPRSATLYYKTQRLAVFLPKPIDTTQKITVTVAGAAYSGPYDIHNTTSSARLYFPIASGSMGFEGQTVKVSYTATDGTSAQSTPLDTIEWHDEQRANDSAAPPTDSVTGLATVIDYAVPLDQSVNENNVSAFLDTDAFQNGSATPSPPAVDAPHKVWLFWNSTRNGTADLYSETIDPRF